ncbi:hypothetical protein M0R45_018896 [Rubus argutus]|uniref:Uncharacterized protein n=1 Tax=Rubus argutus TaxID=59490 RepID=A0AAW1X578_RUBAR
MGACISCGPKPEEIQKKCARGSSQRLRRRIRAPRFGGRNYRKAPKALRVYSSAAPLNWSEASPLDLAAVVRKLTALARSNSSRSSEGLGRSGSSRSSRSGQLSPMHCSSPVLSNYSSSPGRNSPGRFMEPENGPGPMEMYGPQRASRARSWKPLLDTITERSLNQRTESDLQSKRVEAVKYVE